MEAAIELPRSLDGQSDQATRFEAIYRAHYGAVLAYARRRLPARADDVVADTFLVAWRRLGDVPRDALPWLYGVAHRVIAGLRRSARRQEAVAERLASLRQPDVVIELADHDLATALAALSEPDRELLLLVHWEDLAPARAARVLGCSPATVATRLWRARRRLRAELGRLGGDSR